MGQKTKLTDFLKTLPPVITTIGRNPEAKEALREIEQNPRKHEINFRHSPAEDSTLTPRK